jgi:hypothetical protein
MFLSETLCTLWLKRNAIRAPFDHPRAKLLLSRTALREHWIGHPSGCESTS